MGYFQAPNENLDPKENCQKISAGFLLCKTWLPALSGP